MLNVRRASVGLGLGLVVAVLGGAAANSIARAEEPLIVQITIHYSRFEPARITAPVGRAVTFVITNTDPIDHEWIVGDQANHDRHRTGTEPAHGERAAEVSIPAGTERRTTLSFAAPGSQSFICHLSGHESYGMVGTVMVTDGG